MQRTFLWGIVGAILLWAGIADADPPHLTQLLHGDYGFTGEGICLVALPPGFHPNLTPIDGSVTVSLSVRGVRTFNGDGTGTLRSRSLTITHPDIPVTLGGAGSSDSQSSFTYTVTPDHAFTIVSESFTGTVLTGSRAGQTFTIDPYPSLTGLIARDHKSLTLTSEEPTVEVETFSNGDVNYHICHRAEILLKLKQAED